jgi:ribonuclease HII
MAAAVARLRLVPELVLIDGHETVAAISHAQLAVIRGDGRCLSIAAASVLAKVVRDRIMERLDRVWPAYGFARHKGYGTAEHLDALREYGPCPIHRWSFAPVTELELPLV